MSRRILCAALLGLAAAASAQTYNLQGFVKDPRGAGIGGVTVDLYDPVAGTKATAVQNTTLATGQFNAFFTPANPAATTFYVDFAPLPGTGHAAVQLKDQRMTGATVVLPDTILPDAVTLTINVFDTTGTIAQPSVDLDAYDATTSAKIYTPSATTNAFGSVTVDVPPGVLDLLLTPPRGGALGAADLWAQRVAGTTTLNVNLPAAATMTGTVTDSTGAALDRAPISVTDPLTGRAIASRYNTALGAFSVPLAPGTYDFLFEPPAGADLVPVRRAAVAVPGPAMSVVLPAGAAVSGRVTNAAGAAQYQAHFSVETSSLHQGVDVTRARVDSTGAFRFVLPPGTYDLTVLPPPGSVLVPKTLKQVVVTSAPLALGTIVLDAGFVVTGRVMGAGQPVADVNVNAFDSRTGLSVTTSRDHTDATGAFRLTLPAGTYDLDFLPPYGTAWNDQVRAAVGVSANMTLAPDVTLTAGAAVTATITGQGAGALEGASVHLLDSATGADIPLAHQVSGSTGALAFNVDAGTYVLQVLPPAATPWLPLQRTGVIIAAPSTALGTLTLQAGALLEGNVKSAIAPNAPIEDVNVNLFSGGAQILTARDHTDYLGHFTVAVAPGTLDAEMRPPLGTRYLPATRAGLLVTAGGVTITDTLLQEGILVSARTLDAATSAPIPSVLLDFEAGGAAVPASHATSAFDGRIEAAVASGTYVVRAVPPLGSRYAAAALASRALTTDTNLGDLRLSSGFFVGGTVKDAAAQPIAGVTVTAKQSATGTAVALARNVTDAAGVVDWMVLPAGTYDLTFTPPASSSFVATTLTGVTVSADDHAKFAVTLERFTVTSVSPATGTTRGGVAVQVRGTGFSGGAPTVTFGGMPLAGAAIVNATTITGTLPAHPQGAVDVTVTLTSGASATLAAGFTYVPPAPIVLLMSRSGADLVMTWTSNGQPDYAVYRSTSPTVFDPTTLVRTVTTTTTTLANEVGRGSLTFHVVE